MARLLVPAHLDARRAPCRTCRRMSHALRASALNALGDHSPDHDVRGAGGAKAHMVKLNKIYTRTGDDGTTGLADGARRPKDDPRVEAYGAIDETQCRDRRARGSRPATCPNSTPCSRASRMICSISAPISRRRRPKRRATKPLRIVPAPGRAAGAGDRRAQRPARAAALLRAAGRNPGRRRPASRPHHRRGGPNAHGGLAAGGRDGRRAGDALCQSSVAICCSSRRASRTPTGRRDVLWTPGAKSLSFDLAGRDASLAALTKFCGPTNRS